MDTPETSFFMHILDGYAFRNLLGIIKSETDVATMILSPRSMEISFINVSRCAMHKIVINTLELLKYEYNPRDPDGNLVDEYPISFNTDEMYNRVKNLNRRDSIRMYQMAGGDQIIVQPIKSSSKDPGSLCVLFVKIQIQEHSQTEPPGGYSMDPNVRVQAKTFADICCHTNSMKCASLEIIGGHSRVAFRGVLPNNRQASWQEFGSYAPGPSVASAAMSTDMDEEVEKLLGHLRGMSEATPTSMSIHGGLSLNIVHSDDMIKVRVPISTVKTLAKIHNLSPSGTSLKFYFLPSQPIKIESPIGNYGTYTICIRGQGR